MSRFAPVEYPTSRHLATPTHKNSLAVSEKRSSRKLTEAKRRTKGREAFWTCRLGPALLPEHLPDILGCYRKVHEGDGGVGTLGVPATVVADERCPCPA